MINAFVCLLLLHCELSNDVTNLVLLIVTLKWDLERWNDVVMFACMLLCWIYCDVMMWDEKRGGYVLVSVWFHRGTAPDCRAPGLRTPELIAIIVIIDIIDITDITAIAVIAIRRAPGYADFGPGCGCVDALV